MLHLPHACGDEPNDEIARLRQEIICPTHVGMNRDGTQRQPLR